MAIHAKNIVGFCPTHAHAEEAVDKLRLSGFRNTDVAALMRDGGKHSGGVLNWPAGSAVLQREAAEHTEWIENGGIVLVVRCANPDWERRAAQVFQKSMAAAMC